MTTVTDIPKCGKRGAGQWTIKVHCVMVELTNISTYVLHHVHGGQNHILTLVYQLLGSQASVPVFSDVQVVNAVFFSQQCILKFRDILQNMIEHSLLQGKFYVASWAQPSWFFEISRYLVITPKQ